MLQVLRSGALAIAAAAALGFVQQAHGELPTSRLITAPLISPTSAWSYYSTTPGGLARTSSPAAMATLPEIQALARSLGSERISETGVAQTTKAAYARNVQAYVRNNIATEFRFGLGKGARGALIDQSGTPFDQADLMAALLRQGGVAFEYKVGTVQLSAQQIGAWTGMIHGFSTNAQGVQTVSVNAKALCQFLADGAIPATFSVGGTTVSSCASLSGDLSANDTVTIGHIWIEAEIEAESQVFDPAFKALRFTQGMNLGAAIGCGAECGGNAVGAAIRETSGTGPAASGSFGGKPYLSNINEGALNSKLLYSASNLETYLQANAPNATIEQLVGGREIEVTSSPGSPSGYAATYSWSEQIPDGFRSSVSFATRNGTVRLFGDEIAGQRFWSNAGRYIVDNADLGLTACQFSACDQTFAINHPYATNNGAYGDDSVFFNTLGQAYRANPTTEVLPDVYGIVINWGEASSSTESHFAALERIRGVGLFDPSTVTTDACSAKCGNDLPTVGATILKSQSQANLLIDRITDTTTTRHHTVGLIVRLVVPNVTLSTAWVSSLHSSLSANSQTADPGERSASFEIGALMSAMLEGGTRQYAADDWQQGSPTNLIVLANRNGQKLIDVAPGGVNTTLLSALSGYASATKSKLQARAGEGYGFILPEKDAAGTVFSADGWSLGLTFGGSYSYRGASGATNGDDGAQASLMRMDLKGGSPTSSGSPVEAVMRSVKDARGNADQKLAASADLATGAISISATDLVTGSGEFPNSLPFQRYYSSTNGAHEAASDGWWTYEGPDDLSTSHMPGAWRHNYSYAARLGTNLDGALGNQGALGSSAAVAGLYTLFTARSADPFERRLTSLFAINWISEQINNNAVVMSDPTSETVFLRLPSGGYAAPLGAQSKVTVSGTRTSPVVESVNGKVNVAYNYAAVRLTRTFADGSVMTFEPQQSSEIAGTYVSARIFRPMEWTFPGKMKLTFAYHEESYSNKLGAKFKAWILDSVTNSLNRKISFSTTPVNLNNGLVQWRMWRIKSVSDDTLRTASYDVEGCPSERSFVCGKLNVTGADKQITKYLYTSVAAPASNAQTIPRLPYRLWQIQSPKGEAQTIAYDEVLRAKSITDGNALTTRYFVGALAGNEHWKSSAVISPRQDLLESSGAIFDERNNPILMRDGLGHEVINTYDAMGRLVRTKKPEGNAQELTYDLRGNVLSICDIPKERPGKPCGHVDDIVSRKTYVDGDTVWSCANLAKCNKIKTETDPLGNTTTYEWDDDGWLKSVEGPIVVGGQAMTELRYRTYPIDGGVKFLWKKIQRVTSNTSTETVYDYNPLNKYVLSSIVVDPDGKAITTCFSYDARGNLITATDPRAGACQ